MTLYELSFTYEQSAELLHTRIKELRRAAKETTDFAERRLLLRRLRTLKPLMQEMRELAVLCRHYYERSYQKNEKYTL